MFIHMYTYKYIYKYTYYEPWYDFRKKNRQAKKKIQGSEDP